MNYVQLYSIFTNCYRDVWKDIFSEKVRDFSICQSEIFLNECVIVSEPNIKMCHN